MNLPFVVDPFLSIPIIGLVGVSLFLIASTTPVLLSQQLLFFIIGIILFIIFASIDIKIWREFAWVFYLIFLILLVVVFIGPKVRGASRWIELGFFNLQPSELIKPMFILILAHHISKLKNRGQSFLLIPILLFIPVLVLIFSQPDLGNVIVFLVSFLALEIIAGLPWIYVLFGFITVSLFTPAIWVWLKPYQRLRLISFLSPNTDPQGVGYNALQSIIAIGSGQIFGLGLGRGTQSHLLFLPEYYTDFIFASLGEELGFIGSSIVVLFYFIMLLRILLISYNSDNKFGQLLSIGIFAQLFIQVVINIGMNLGLLPITGITLPLLSYGGSSIISTFIGLGLVSSISRAEKVKPLVIR